MTTTVIGYLTLIRIDFYDSVSPFSLLGLVSIEKIYHTPKTVFGHHSTHLEVHKNRLLRVVFSALLGV